jgi:hypothetical protein
MAQQQGGAPHASDYAESIDITPTDVPAPGEVSTPADSAEASAEGTGASSDGAPPGDDAVPAGAEPSPSTAGPGSFFTRRRIVLGSLLAVGLAGAAVFGVAGMRILQQKDATLSAPERVAGLTRDDSAQAADMADYLRTALAAGLELDGTVGAVYNDPANADRGVLFYGGTALIFRPERELNGLFGMLDDATGKVSDLREVPAGDLGGVMKCGSVSLPEGNMSVCGWADHGSVAVAMFPDRSVTESASLMRDLRKQIQTRD